MTVGISLYAAPARISQGRALPAKGHHSIGLSAGQQSATGDQQSLLQVRPYAAILKR